VGVLEGKSKNLTQRREAAKETQSIQSLKWQNDSGQDNSTFSKSLFKSIILPLNYFAFILFAHSLRLCPDSSGCASIF
jgi:lipopolysaccharide export LptBFGC system permease protein LptF